MSSTDIEIEKESEGIASTIRSRILEFESAIKKSEDAISGDSNLLPLEHHFAEGVYVRELFIPKGIILVGKIHKHEHLNIILKGEITVFSEDGGEQRIKAPAIVASPAGTKRIGYTHEDTVWANVHPNPDNIKDMDVLEDLFIAKSFEEYEEFIESKKEKLLA